MFYLTRTPDSEQTDFTVVSINRPQTPQRVVQAIAVEDLQNAHRLVVSRGFAQRAQQRFPALFTGRMFADFVQCRFHDLFSR
jgi:hypothetical protein